MEDKGWSYLVTHRIPATYHSQGVYTRSPEEIYKEMRRPEVSPRGLSSAIQMNQFYINRAGRSLPEERKEAIRESIRYLQTELRYHNALAKGDKNLDELKKEWEALQSKVDLSGEPEPVRYTSKPPPAKEILEQGVNKYLQKIARCVYEL